MASWRLAYKNMPVDLILVRHGESEGNLAQKMAQQGGVPNPWTSGFRARHNSKYRLTDRGRAQAEAAGEWIKDHIGEAFDICLTSEYIRAMETAAYLHIQEAEWRTEFFLRERDRGVLANKSKQERRREHADEIERQDRDSFYFQPSGGESIANLCLRVESVIKHLQKGSAGLRVIIVCHGGVIKAFRALVERKRQMRASRSIGAGLAGGESILMNQLLRSSIIVGVDASSMSLQIYNGMVIHYSRRNPTTGLISDNYHWVRCACPWRPSLVNENWIHFSPHVLSNDTLLAEVQKVPQLVNERFDQALGRYPHEEPSSPTSDYAETVTERPSRCKHFDVVVDLFVGVVTGLEAIDLVE
ncbi:2,3-bisphosphoglycerate-dependent phosphoglycerate mutase, putative [Perkinsus marinus ATCC 50983]|uniref:phosphoglycerate mutase (2,3-diphosphoglycerate-dependent) n=1 Tax=Perkinsus marinus (strain ATCC 50983 / TXsc) TaxID=423536 RepID=C5L2S2_PERM5|nr:2,3-bisphosphoglycerate-dependent phosphoglycerate mutase, putative [Perkinsus marinus ATCC 50983]EER08987.1 2,3-bisphosphoglycerate-dependent phosphoglycerate mutase, putative [Perkinsus marinus ATCC 50983]|eukprot:XP_002777171.1 2,3-bisphosphoglycerate-dependent phosphoglycerate mutase, putative [Perkinsus marinus ATCC 50983]